MKLIVKSILSNNTIKSSQITLTKSNFLGSGGEGDVYIKNGNAYKIYDNSARMIPQGKLIELSDIKNDYVIRPQEYLIDTNNKIVGYSMRYVTDTISLCQTFTKAFRNRNSITH